MEKTWGLKLSQALRLYLQSDSLDLSFTLTRVNTDIFFFKRESSSIYWHQVLPINRWDFFHLRVHSPRSYKRGLFFIFLVVWMEKRLALGPCHTFPTSALHLCLFFFGIFFLLTAVSCESCLLPSRSSSRCMCELSPRFSSRSLRLHLRAHRDRVNTTHHTHTHT